METNANIQGKVVVITGASSGIGETTAQLVAARGAQVVLGARRTDRLQALADRIQLAGGQVRYLPIDVTHRKEVERLAALALEQFGQLDVMINNAGTAQLSLLEDGDVTGWEEMIDINLKGVLYGVAAVLPIFKKQGFGHIINIISTAGIKITPMMGVYAGTKNAVRTITEALRQESNGRWRVTGISPGFVKTSFADQIRNESMQQAIRTSADQMAIPAEAIAEAVAYAIAQPSNVDVGDIVLRPTLQD